MHFSTWRHVSERLPPINQSIKRKSQAYSCRWKIELWNGGYKKVWQKKNSDFFLDFFVNFDFLFDCFAVKLQWSPSMVDKTLWSSKPCSYLDRVDEIGELDGVLDEKDGHVISDQVEISLFRVEFRGPSPDVADRVRRAAAPAHRGKAHKHRRDLAGVLQKFGLGDVGQRLVHLKVAVSGGAPCVHNPLGNTFMVKVGELFPERWEKSQTMNWKTQEPSPINQSNDRSIESQSFHQPINQSINQWINQTISH